MMIMEIGNYVGDCIKKLQMITESKQTNLSLKIKQHKNSNKILIYEVMTLKYCGSNNQNF